MPKCDLPVRCSWVGDDPLYLAYHDDEWGVPLKDDRALFELLSLEGFQAGLSWITILRKRENFRRAFDGFDPDAIARYSGAKLAALVEDSGIVRNRAKIEAMVTNAQGYLAIVEETGSFTEFVWQVVEGSPKINRWRRMSEVPAETPQSKDLSKLLKARGFRFVGPTICYAFMQAAGLVNDHTIDCFRYTEVG